MKIFLNYIILFTLLSTIISSCTKDEIYPDNKFDNDLSFPDNSEQHPKSALYQSIIDRYVKKGVIGTSVSVRDSYGVWLGVGGMANIASNIPIGKGCQFMIASVSKVFTATLIFSLVDDGVLTIDDPVNKWIDKSITDKIDNANQATIANLLGHTSGIPDYYTVAFEMARYNVKYNYFSQEDILKYVYGKKADFPVGQTYAYSNTNYLLLGMIIEKATGKKLKEVYYERIFTPLGLQNAYYDIKEKAAPSTLISGYYNLYGNGYIESAFLYKDELSTGDGGIIITAQDLGVFFDKLMHGDILSKESLDKMQDWFDIPDGEKNGYGLEYYTNDYGISYGHTGGVDGFTAFANYYPEQDVTIIVLLNYTPGSEESFNTMLEFLDNINKAVFD